MYAHVHGDRESAEEPISALTPKRMWTANDIALVVVVVSFRSRTIIEVTIFPITGSFQPSERENNS